MDSFYCPGFYSGSNSWYYHYFICSLDSFIPVHLHCMYLKISSCALTQTISGQLTNDLDHRFYWLVFSKNVAAIHPMPLPHLLLVVMERWNSCVFWPGWLLLTYSNTVMLKDTRVSTFVMTIDGIHHCRFRWIFDAMMRVGASVARLGGKRKILVEVGPGTSCTGPTIITNIVKRAIAYYLYRTQY